MRPPHLKSLVPALFAIVMLCGPTGAHAQTLPQDFEAVTVVSDLTAPTAVDWAPDGRMFVVEKQGRLKVLNPGASTATTLLDISSKVNTVGDRGLLGLAVDSSFASNGYLYLLYVFENNAAQPTGFKSSRLTRVTVRPDNTLENPASPETAILGKNGASGCPSTGNTIDCLPAEAHAHAIGTVRSDPDGTLWVGSGDAGPSTVHQRAFRVYNEESLAGKIVHIDREGHGLAGHPFCPSDNDLTHVCTKLYAKGFRNPFRFTLRGGGKGPVVGDVGWNTREEIDLLQPGKNYGWPCYEGTIRTPGYDATAECAAEYAKEGTAGAAVPPVHDYPRGDSGAAMAGPTYTADAYPPEYHGDVFFGDFVHGFISRLELTSDDQLAGTPAFGSDFFGFVDLELAPNGNLTYVEFGDGSAGTGAVREIRFSPGNRTPVARASANPEYGPAPLLVQFTGDESFDADGNTLTYDWDFGDGSLHSTQANPAHLYVDGTRNFTATLTVSDGNGESDSDSVTISPGNQPPSARIIAPADNSTYRDGQPVTLTGEATDEGNPLPGSSLQWHMIMHHGSHVHDFGNVTGASSSFAPAVDHDADSFYEIELRATDSRGLSDTETVTIRPETRSFTLASAPSGAPVSYSGTSQTAPFTHQAAIGFEASISAAQRFTQGGRTYEFASWSDGGARVHTVTIPASDTTLTATYRELPPSPYRDAVMGTPGLVSYWRLGEAFGTTAADETGTHPGSYVGGVSLGQPGALPGDADWAARFDGLDDELTATGFPLSLGANGTLEGWFFWEAGVALWRDSTTTGGWIAGYESGGKLAYRVAGQSVFTAVNTSTLRNGWHHLALTKSGPSTALYLDGALAHNATGAPNTPAALPWRAMHNGTSSQYSRGGADELAIYNRALTASEVQQHFQAAAGGGGPPPGPPAAPTGLSASPGNGSVTLDWNDNSESDLAGYEVHRSTTSGGPYTKLNATLLQSSAYTDATAQNGTTYHYVVRALDDDGNPSPFSSQVSATPQAPSAGSYRDMVMATSGLISYWRLGEAAGTTAADEKGAHPGSYVGGVTLAQPGALTGDSNTAARFDGTNDELTATGSPLALGAEGTLEGWFFWEAGVALWRDSTSAGGWIAGYESGGKLAYRVAGQSVFTAVNTSSLRNGWHHLALTKTGPSTALYLDGAHVHNATGAPNTPAAMPWRAMHNGTSSQYSRGRADELAIYNRALSAAEVAQHHQAGIGGGGGGPPPGPPAAPTGLTASPGNGSVTLDWNDNSESDLAGYEVHRSTTSGGPYTKLNATLLQSSAYTDTTTQNGTTYHYVVRALDNDANQSPFSTQASATPQAPGSSSYRDTVLGTTGLVSYWRLGEASGTTAADERGAHPGTYVGGVTLGQPGALTGDANTSVRFDGTNDELTATGAPLALGAEGTLEGWFFWETGVALWRDSTSAGGWIAGYESGGKLAYRVAGQSVFTPVNTSSLKNGWHHLALTKSGPSTALYLDGAHVHNATGAPNTAAALPWRAMHNGTVAGQFSRGRADELAIYNRALTPAEVQQHYQAGTD